MNLVPRQLDLLRVILQAPRHSHSFLREEFSAAPPELLHAVAGELSEMENAGLVELSGRWWYITQKGRDHLDARPALTPSRTFGNATMREPLMTRPWTSVRPGADNHLNYESLRLTDDVS